MMLTKGRFTLSLLCLGAAPLLISSIRHAPAPTPDVAPPPLTFPGASAHFASPDDLHASLLLPAPDLLSRIQPPASDSHSADPSGPDSNEETAAASAPAPVIDLIELEDAHIELTGIDLARRQIARGLNKPVDQTDEQDQSLESLKQIIRETQDRELKRLLPLIEDLKKAAAGSERDQAELDYRAGLVEDLGPIALYVQEKTGLPAVVILAQAIYESGWGGSNITIMKNNVLGIGVCTASEFFEVTLELGDEVHDIPVRCVEGTTAFAFDSIADSMLYYAYALLQSEDNEIHYADLRSFIRNNRALAMKDPVAYRNSVVKLICKSYHPDSDDYRAYLQRIIASLEDFGIDRPFGRIERQTASASAALE